MLITLRLFRTTTLILSSALLFVTCPVARATPPRSQEVQLDGWLRPTEVWRTYSGVCGGDRYEISIWPGRPLFEAVRDIRVNDKSYVSNLRAGVISPSIEGTPVDAVVSKCTETGAEIRFDVPARSDRRTIHFYYMRLSRNGDVSTLIEM